MQPRIIKKDRVHVQEGAPARREGPSRPAADCAKSVRLLEEDGLVHAVELTCSCGEKTVLQLEYAPEPDSPVPIEPEP